MKQVSRSKYQFQIKRMKVKIPNWQKEDQLAITTAADELNSVLL